jgi:RNA polymerase sigma factor (sigma-70 family)
VSIVRQVTNVMNLPQSPFVLFLPHLSHSSPGRDYIYERKAGWMKLNLSETPLPLMDHSRTGSRDATGTHQTADSARFESYFERYWTGIYRLLLRMLGDPAEAEDLTLEAFYRLHEKGPALEPEANVGGWLYRVAMHLGLHSLRALRRRDSYERSAGQDALDTGTEASPLEIVSQRESRNLARAALARMDPRRSQLLLLRYSGMSYKDIAAALDLSPTSIGPLLLRAEREFEKRYRALAEEES